MKYDFLQVEEKWQSRWKEAGIFSVNTNTIENKFYTLVMFPYPSGDKLHMGHWYQYGLMDSWARFQRMKGKKLFFPMGFDAFGLPAENFAIKHKIHPDQSTTSNVNYMMTQFSRMGVSYNFEYKVDTSKPDYYKWTQWVFLQLYKNGLAYKKAAPVNWCNSCQTVLANEQVHEGACERCSNQVQQKNLEQWFFKITNYAQRLLDNLETLDWPDKTKAMQKHWIGRSQGAHIDFAVFGMEQKFTVFTTRPDTLFGVTYVTLAPEHPLVKILTVPKQKEEVEDYVLKSAKITELERLSSGKEKTGVFTGSYAINPANDEKVPIWISDYVLYSYGTGAVMAVPAHDTRDFEFAKRFDLPVRKVILQAGTDATTPLQGAYTEEGIIVNSPGYNGLSSEEMREKITMDLEAKGLGKKTVNFRLRDWLVSRQRYWGAPIPVVYCQDCGIVPIAEKDLPVVLPENVEFMPTGESPLKSCQEFLHTPCPRCQKPAKREVDTLDTFVCSSWYYLRFPSANRSDCPFDKELTNKMLPVDKYVGGPEHACMHLLYARFINMVMHDLGHVNFEEPFTSLTHQGMILGPDGQKMSKSKGNSVSPDGYVKEYGSDILRLYLAFGFNYIDGGPWDEGGFKAMVRYSERLNRLFSEVLPFFDETHPSTEYSKNDRELMRVLHQSIRGVETDTQRFQFNTSIARLMELYNALSDYLRLTPSEINKAMVCNVCEEYLRLLTPFMPHFCEEWWERTGHKTMISQEPFAQFEEKWLVREEITIAVMINGKRKTEILIPAQASEEDAFLEACKQPIVAKQLETQKVIKKIFVPGKLINLIFG